MLVGGGYRGIPKTPNKRIKQMICFILAGYAWNTENPYVIDSKRRFTTLAEFADKLNELNELAPFQGGVLHKYFNERIAIYVMLCNQSRAPLTSMVQVSDIAHN